MKMTKLRLSNFQSFGKGPTVITLDAMCFLLGPNGTGKTAVLQALARLFGFDPSLRRVRRTDFHVTAEDLAKGDVGPLTLWIEAQFEFPELKKIKGKHPTIPGNFAHMQLESADGIPRVRFRLTAKMDEDGDIDETIHYVVQADEQDEPVKTSQVPKQERNEIQVHYLPARRDPTDHISYTANSLLGREEGRILAAWAKLTSDQRPLYRDMLLRKLESSDSRDRLAALTAFAALRDPGLQSNLLSLRSDPSPAVRQRVAYQLGRLKRRDVIPALEVLM